MNGVCFRIRGGGGGGGWCTACESVGTRLFRAFDFSLNMHSMMCDCGSVIVVKYAYS